MKNLPVLDANAAAIDVGSEKLHVSIAGEAPKVFGTFTGDLENLRDWFQERGVRTVAMEATGVYWLYLYEVLEAAGLAVVVVNGRHARNVPGRKTDMADCQWLVLQLISEVGTDMTRWPSEKHFVSWLGLAGGRKQSGKRKGRVKARRNRAGRMFCMAARPLAKSVDKALGGFYRRLRGRIGGLAANVALARKLALLFYRLLRHGMQYVEKGLKSYEARVVETEARLLRKLAKKQGFALVPSALN